MADMAARGTESAVDDGNRRDFLYLLTAATTAVGAGALCWPLVDSMNPSADVLALGSVDLDLSGIEEGMAITAKWRGKPVFIRHRTPAEIAAAREVDLGALPLSRAFIAERGQGRPARLFVAAGGDDYALLAAIPSEVDPSVTLSLPNEPILTCIGKLVPGAGVTLVQGGKPIPLPERLGYEHRTQHPPVDDRG